MNKEKQIEEMCAIMADASYAACEDTPLVPESAGICDKVDCHRCKEARRLMNAGYRKAAEVARETVEAIKAEVSKQEQYVNDLFGYGGFVIATTDLEDIIRRHMFDNYEEAELKKKYAERRTDK